jgi:catechol 2,3-dioxygenase-like lactoylglutathione lyase family enzyme
LRFSTNRSESADPSRPPAPEGTRPAAATGRAIPRNGSLFHSLGGPGSCALNGLRLSLDSEEQMISGAHIVVYSKNAEADRAFFRDVLGFKSVDAGHGWLIFALPPAEAAVHPSDASAAHELYFMCDDLKVEMTSLEEKGIECSEVQEQRWGSITKMRLPGGGEVGLYQPNHPTALDLK